MFIDLEKWSSVASIAFIISMFNPIEYFKVMVIGLIVAARHYHCPHIALSYLMECPLTSNLH